MRKWIAILIMILVSFNFYLSVKHMKPVSQNKKEIAQVLEEIDEKIHTQYPDDPEDVIAIHNTLMDNLYTGKLTDEQVQAVVELQRELYEKDFLDLTSQEDQLEEVHKELLMLGEKSIKILDSKIMNAYEEPPGVMKMEVTHYTNQADLIRLYLLRKETGQEKEKWKIFGWKDIKSAQIQEEKK